jgi:hypothetical protein
MTIAVTMRAAVMNAILLFFISPPAPFVLLDSTTLATGDVQQFAYHCHQEGEGVSYLFNINMF